ncbi:hypothetical protein NG821_00785 [Prevotella cerevisiae]|uniref:Lipocalin-like domain-containing protein n=1 Tax=Segatella cerevisiae TaxID=2053716 RepID=A0ABT1BVW6_9BACT|nr:hypothetical protein [Segatella cerevisiae]MCO6024393.1 hypothetical protein [Segatella cerevisiae]
MKRLKLGLLLALAIISLGTTCSCSNDDDNDSGQQSDLADLVSKNYNGVSSALFAYITDPMINEGDTVIVTKAGTDNVNVSYRGMTWGKGTFDAAKVTENDTAYVISGDGDMVMSMSGGKGSSYKATLTAYVNKKDPSSFSFKISVPSVMGGTVVSFLPHSAFTADQLIANDYVAKASGAFKYSDKPLVNDSDSITITSAGKNKVNISYIGKTWGHGTFENADVVTTDTAYTVSGKGTINMGMDPNSPAKPYDATFTAVIKRNSAAGDFKFTIDVPSVMGGTVITLTPQDAK